MMIEKICPLCSKPVRSDALTREYCKLCGMIINYTEPLRVYTTKEEINHYFCCRKCMNTYLTNLFGEEIKNNTTTVEDIYEEILLVKHKERNSHINYKKLSRINVIEDSRTDDSGIERAQVST